MPKRKRGVTAEITSKLPVPKSTIFPFLELPAELRIFDLRVSAEALPFLYNGPLLVPVRPFGQVPFRKDQNTRGTRGLRNGRQISMTSFTGLIYPHVLARFRKLQLSLNLFYLLGFSNVQVEDDSFEFRSQIHRVIKAIAPTMQASFQGLRVQDLEISVDNGELLSSVLDGYKSPEKISVIRHETEEAA
ncbi:MAG: hypothetical protein M1830_000436 [Pleopsidium flavum]|nr:MAG: hypothetical protein M1830_000436 [Pleopsidium flavum]